MISGQKFADELRAILKERHDEAEEAKKGKAAAWSHFMYPCLVDVAERLGLWWASSAVPSRLDPSGNAERRGERREYLWDLTLFARQGVGSGDWGMPLVIVEHENAWSEAAFRVDHWKTLCAFAPLRVAIGYARNAAERKTWIDEANAAVGREHWTFPQETEDLLVLGFGGMTVDDFGFHLRGRGAKNWLPLGAP